MGKVKKAMFVLLSVIGVMCASICALAENASGTANSDTVSAMTGLANDMIATGNAVIPVALGVVGIAMVVVFGIKIFRRVVGRA